MKTSEEQIRELFRQLGSDSKRETHAAEEELRRIVSEEGQIRKELCCCPEFAEWDEDYASDCDFCVASCRCDINLLEKIGEVFIFMRIRA